VTAGARRAAACHFTIAHRRSLVCPAGGHPCFLLAVTREWKPAPVNDPQMRPMSRQRTA
jgi:hypothetical protein